MSRKANKKSKNAHESAQFSTEKIPRFFDARDFKPYDIPASFKELGEKVLELVEEVRTHPKRAEDIPEVLFDPTLEHLRDLPIGVLDQRETPLPPSLLPKRRAELQDFCERLIVRNRREDVIQEVCARWPQPEMQKKTLDRHVTELWRLHDQAPELYEYLLTGHHGSALNYLRNNRLPDWLDDLAFVGLLTRMGLLWCAHDIQIIMARNFRAAHFPFETLVSTNMVQVKPITAVNAYRPFFNLMGTLLMAYATAEEQASGKSEIEENDPLLSDSLFVRHSNYVEHAHPKDSDFWVGIQDRLDALMDEARREIGEPSSEFLRQLAKEAGDGPIEAGFSQIWFSGLAPLASASVPILRYIHAERFLGVVIRRAVASVRAGRELDRPLLRLSGLNLDYYGNWRPRARKLLAVYRSAVLDDKDNWGSASRTKAPIDAAVAFLRNVGGRDFMNLSEAPTDEAHTLYQLDILPDVRLWR